MSVSLSITAKADTPAVRRLMELSGPNARRERNEAMGHEIQRLTYRHLTDLAATRHGTANKLGATPSGHFEKAAEKVQADGALSVDEGSATLTIAHPGISRAFKRVTIRPKTAKSLALPIHALAFNHRAAELWDQYNLFIPKGARSICMRQGERVVALYWLTKRVTQEQDRSLLPSTEEFEKAAARGSRKYIRLARRLPASF